MQARVRRQQDRMSELCALRRPLTDSEANEMMRLKHAANVRKAYRKWSEKKRSEIHA
jgi:hypothetical protein